MTRYIKVLSTLLCFTLLHQNGIECNSRVCPEGHKLNYNTKLCEPCPTGYYKAKSGIGLTCDRCSKCEKGSFELKQCTSTTDSVCFCFDGFTSNDSKKENCICKKGFGVDKGKCIACENGYFSDKDDSTCQKWRECKSGILNHGTSTSDVVCNEREEEPEVKPEVTTVKTTQETTLPLKTKITPAPTLITISSPVDSFYIIWLVAISTGILLLAWLLYRKCKVTHCFHKIKKLDAQKEGKCRTPVEESGAVKCESLLV